MPRDLPFVFVSSTFRMAAERLSVKKALDPPLDVPLYEQEPAPGTSAEAECERMIRLADFWIGVHGADWGTPFNAEQGTSIVEWEFELAQRRAREGLPIFAFLSVDPNDSAAPIDARQREFLQRLGGVRSISYQRFSDKDDLAHKVQRAVMGWMARVKHGAARTEAVRQTGFPVYLALAAVFLAIGAVGLVALANVWITSAAALAVIGAATLGFGAAVFFAGHARALRPIAT